LKLAAIDIGSNAIRLLIEEIIEGGGDFHIHKVSLTRVPLRLGEDVFVKGKIGKEKARQLMHTLKAFSYLMKVHDVHHFRVCATSAMREAGNRDEILKMIRKETDLLIEVISGKEEAELILGNFSVQHLDPAYNYLYIDVGGGSTELTLIARGEREKSKSFPVGTVRILANALEEDVWSRMDSWISRNISNGTPMVGMGTGGNINRIHKECGKKTNEAVTLQEIRNYRNEVASYELEDRIIKLKLKPDRADVIVPAADIYINVMEQAGITDLFVPKLGLSDGIILDLYSKWRKGRLSV